MTQKNKNTDAEKEALRLEYCFEKGVNIQDRIIQITGEIQEGSSFDYLDAALTEMERASKSSVTIKINSPGGSVYEALAMVDRIKDSRCHILTKCYGHAMSAASLILAAGDRRAIGTRSWLLHHEISYGTSGAHSTVKDQVDQAEREMNQWAHAMAEFSTKPAKFWLETARKKDFYLNARQCLEAGIVEEIF